MSFSVASRPALLLAWALTVAATQTAGVVCAEEGGGALIPSFPGTTLASQTVADVATYQLVVGYDAKTQELRGRAIQGRLTRSVYNNPRDRSILEIHDSYRSSLKEFELETLFECEGEGCGPGFEPTLWERFNGIVAFSGKGSRYLAGVFERDGSLFYVAVMVGNSRTQVDLVESNDVVSALFTVSADALAADLVANGRATLHGIYFDSGRSTLKPESEPALRECAKFLRQHPEIKVFLVGHTDARGPYEMNMELSKARAQAVARALTTDYEIAEERIVAQGVGPLAPVAPNTTIEGRAKNRRVEVVGR